MPDLENATPTPSPGEDDPDARVDCPECHGMQQFACSEGCHLASCRYCDGTGEVHPDELPAED